MNRRAFLKAVGGGVAFVSAGIPLLTMPEKPLNIPYQLTAEYLEPAGGKPCPLTVEYMMKLHEWALSKRIYPTRDNRYWLIQTGDGKCYWFDGMKKEWIPSI